MHISCTTPRRSLPVAALALATALIVALTGLVSPAPAAAEPAPPPGILQRILSGSAVPVEPADPFYEQSFPATAPGTLLDARPVTPPLDFETYLVARSHTLLYSSTNAAGESVTTSGLALQSHIPWIGVGPRPVVVMAPVTRGIGDHCAISRSFTHPVRTAVAEGRVYTNEDLSFAYGLLARGITVVVTDYQGLGTPGEHAYMNRLEQGHAVLDLARAVPQLSAFGYDVSPATPLGLWGYSQGGGAVAAAAELQPTYAPEVQLTGAFAGGVPADQRVVLDSVDNSRYGAYLLYALRAMILTDPAAAARLEHILTPEAIESIAATRDECGVDTQARVGTIDSRTLFRDGRSAEEVIASEPVLAAAVQRQQLGTLTPTTPVVLMGADDDDLIPARQIATLRQQWCAQGAQVYSATLPSVGVDWAPGQVHPGAIVAYFLPSANQLQLLLQGQQVDLPRCGGDHAGQDGQDGQEPTVEGS